MSKTPETTVDAKWTWNNCRDTVRKLETCPEYKTGIRLLGYLLQSNGHFRGRIEQ